MIPLVLALHTMAAVAWVGGMFFVIAALRPALAPLPLPERLGVWRRALERFFLWVWISVAVLLVSGYVVVFFGYQGFASVGLHIHIMQVTGLIMVLLFVLMWAMPWQEFRHAHDAGHFEDAAKSLARIRLVASINLPLGLFTSVIGATGSFWTY
jgi:uncharacterized membrane protein